MCKYEDCKKEEDKASAILRYGSGNDKLGIYYDASGKFPNFKHLFWQNNAGENIDEKVKAIRTSGNLKPVLFRGRNFTDECEVLDRVYDANLGDNEIKEGGIKGKAKTDTVSSLKILIIQK